MQPFFQTIGEQWHSLYAFFAFDAALLAEPSILFRLVLLGLLLCGSAFFSSSETALFSLSRLDLQQLRREHNPQSETLHALLDQPRRLIISILTGNELINVAATVNAAGILVTLYGTDRAGWISIVFMVPLVLLFGEITPKTIAVSNPVRFSTAVVAVPLSAWVRLVAPLRNVIRLLSDRLTTQIVGEEKSAESLLNIDEFLTLVEQVAQGGELDATERALINNLLEANETEIVEIMTPRTRTDFLNADMPVPEIITRFRELRHTRVPVFRVHRDNLIGFIHAEDVLQLFSDGVDLDRLSTEEIIHPPVVVPLTKKVDEMFDFFRENGVRAAVCLNEFGGVEGFITIYDVLTFIFGDISGETRGRSLYQERDLNIYELPGEMKLTDVNNLTNFGLDDPRMTTIGGVAFRHLDRLPQAGDRVVIDDIALTVLNMDAHRISKVRVAKTTAEEDLSEMTEVKRAELTREQTTPDALTEDDSDYMSGATNLDANAETAIMEIHQNRPQDTKVTERTRLTDRGAQVVIDSEGVDQLISKGKPDSSTDSRD
jgi:putative hemolysin